MGDAAGGVGGAVGGTVGGATGDLGGTVGGATGAAGGLLDGNLLNVDVNVDADADIAAPINGAVAANANVAAPIDAAVAANVGSVGSDAVAVSQQDAIINQDITGSADATSDQHVRHPAVAPDGRACRASAGRADDALRRRPSRRGCADPATSPSRADGVELHRRDGGLRLPRAARAGPPRRRPDHPADPAALPRAGGGRRPARLRRGRRAGQRAAYGRTVTAGQRPHPRRPAAAAAGPARAGRRVAARGEEVQPAAGAAVQVRRHRPGAHPSADGAVRPAVQPRRRGRRCWPPSRPSAGGCSWRRAWPPRRTRPSTSPACCCWSSRSRCSRPASTSSATPRPRAAAAPRPGAMGAGLYLVWPAFYTDVTDSYRLGRGGRVRTDLGGLYFNAIVAVAHRGRLVG